MARGRAGVPSDPPGNTRGCGRHPPRRGHAARPDAGAFAARGLGPRPPREDRGAEPDRFLQGPRHDGRGLAREGARGQSGALRVDREHFRVGGRVCGARGASLRGGDPGGADRAGEARAGHDLRGARARDPREFRPRARAGAQYVRGRQRGGGQLHQPGSHPGAEDRGLRGRPGARRPRARRPRPSGRKRGEHHRYLERLRGAGGRRVRVRSLGGRGLRVRRRAAQDARLPGRGRGPDRPRRPGGGSHDDRDRDQDREPRLVEGRARCARPLGGVDRDRDRRRDPGRLSSPRGSGGDLRRARLRRERRGCSEARRAGPAQGAPHDRLHGDGLKDPERAVSVSKAVEKVEDDPEVLRRVILE